MKKLFNLVVVLLAVLAFNACGDKNAPEAVAEKYLQHIAKKQWEEAKKLGTESTHQMVDMLSSFGDDAEVKELTVTDMKCEVNDDAASCTFKSNGEEDKLDLVKVDGKWLVDQKKEMPSDDDFNFDFEEEEEVVEEASTDEVVVDEVAAE